MIADQIESALMMRLAPPRVLMINRGSIFDSSLLELLRSTVPDVLDVNDRDEPALIQAIVRFKPQIVIMNDSDEGGAIRLLKLFSDLQLIQHLRVIVVQIADNVIQQYEIKQVVATESADLVALITQLGISSGGTYDSSTHNLR